jgi:signal transduction histidine kinase
MDGSGPLSALVAAGEATSGKARVFSRDEVFPAEGTWCDLIPMDSTVEYVFIPLSSLPLPESAAGLGRGAMCFVLAADDLGAAGAWDLPLRASFAASLIGLSMALQGPPRESGTLSITGRERLRLLSRFMSSVAHEIKNPLTGIAAGVQYLARKAQAGLEGDETVEFILSEINRLNRIVDDLYRIARPPELVLQQIDLKSILGKSLICLSEGVTSKRIVVEQHIETEIPEIEADPDRLQQVFINIIKNAVEASPEGGTVRLEMSRGESRVIIRVTDGGRGIGREEMEKVFDPFYSTKERGSGLGLCVSQRIIDEHGGSIRIETPAGGGTSFVIEIPIRR